MLRADNADQRLTPRGIALGCVCREREVAFSTKLAVLEEARQVATDIQTALTPNALAERGIQVNKDGIRRTAQDLLRYPGILLEQILSIWPALNRFDAAILEQIEIDGRYAGYLDRQEADILAYRKEDALQLPENLDYAAVGSLSNEIRLKLETARPRSLGSASRIPGVTPAALIALMRHVKRSS